MSPIRQTTSTMRIQMRISTFRDLSAWVAKAPGAWPKLTSIYDFRYLLMGRPFGSLSILLLHRPFIQHPDLFELGLVLVKISVPLWHALHSSGVYHLSISPLQA